MKRLLVIGMLLVFSTASGQSTKSLQGAYRLTRQVFTVGGKDTVTGINQAKLFTDRYMIYAHAIPGDSLAAYGIGTYQPVAGGIMEQVFHTSANGARRDTFKLEITPTKDGFIQVIRFPPSNDTTYVLTEEYVNSGRQVSTPLDGAWRQTKTEWTDQQGRVQTNATPVQFKVFQSGNFIWANTYTDSATKKPVSAFGYGTFDMKGMEVIENVTHTTYTTDLVGKPVTLQIALTGKDGYNQTIRWPDGTKLVEYYERLK